MNDAAESIREVRQHLADVVERAADTPTVITRRGREVAAIVSIADYRRLRGLDEDDRQAWAARVAALPKVTGDVDMLDVLKAAREERDDELAR